MQNALVGVSNGRLEPELVLFLGVEVEVGVGVWVGASGGSVLTTATLPRV